MRDPNTDGSLEAPYRVRMPRAVRIALLMIMYAVGAVAFAAVLAPIIHWWAIPAGMALLALVLRLPRYSDWQ